MKKTNRRVESEAKRKDWQRHIESCMRSEESQASYCVRHGLRTTQFTYWKKKLSQLSSSSKFISLPLQLSRGKVSAGSSLYLEYGGRFRIEVPKGFDTSTLEELLHTLGRV